MGKVRKGIEPLKLTNALPLFDGIPKPTNGSTIVFHFAERKISDFTENDTPSDIIQGQSCSSSASNVTDRHYIIKVLSFCSRVGSLEIGRRCHALITKTGLGGDKFISTSLIDMYAKCGEMENAGILFDKMARLDIASCNCLISGYARNGLLDQAFEFFMNIGSLGMRPNHYTYSIMLTVCRTLSAIQEGKQLHAHIVKLQYLSETAVGNALLTMYNKFGMVEEAEFLFESLAERNLISWTAIITGFYQHGAFDKALRHFHLMIKSGIKPNEYTFTIVLVSCGSMKDLVNGRNSSCSGH
ncbi:hypothetical protein L1049_013142 [Liquidambar formosana]|uniref:Pentatricopeptide repeat-containing protein n=1 Tax=Liquidambar formosana TaxID=63359 RepID=A0AAP0RLG5_LIQFO